MAVLLIFSLRRMLRPYAEQESKKPLISDIKSSLQVQTVNLQAAVKFMKKPPGKNREAGHLGGHWLSVMK